jgi:branched-chain amino acid transport system ATP-binding protein
MLAIGRALLRKPRLLMLDEPSLGLTPEISRHVFDALVAICRTGTTILLVEQNARLALKVAQRAAILEGGRIVLQGTPAELAENQDVRDVYLGVGAADAATSVKTWRLYRKRRRW